VDAAAKVCWQLSQFVGNALVNEFWYCDEHSVIQIQLSQFVGNALFNEFGTVMNIQSYRHRYD
jgi:hypothetical protein